MILVLSIDIYRVEVKEYVSLGFKREPMSDLISMSID